MKHLVLGGAGFLGSWLVSALLEDPGSEVAVFDCQENDFIRSTDSPRFSFVQGTFDADVDFCALLTGVDVVYHLISTTVPGNSNTRLLYDVTSNIIPTLRLLDACVACGVGKVVFFSSGGTVYGVQSGAGPILESAPTNPISSYGVQKLAIEKYLKLFNYNYGLEYLIVRLSNPFGPRQNISGRQGVVTTFTYRVLHDLPITLYGDGSVVRDYIDVRDAVSMVINAAGHASAAGIYNIGSGIGYSLKQIISIVEERTGKKAAIDCRPGRNEDVPVNVLSIEKYLHEVSPVRPRALEEGIDDLIAYFNKQDIERNRC